MLKIISFILLYLLQLFSYATGSEPFHLPTLPHLSTKETHMAITQYIHSIQAHLRIQQVKKLKNGRDEDDEDFVSVGHGMFNLVDSKVSDEADVVINGVMAKLSLLREMFIVSQSKLTNNEDNEIEIYKDHLLSEALSIGCDAMWIEHYMMSPNSVRDARLANLEINKLLNEINALKNDKNNNTSQQKFKKPKASSFFSDERLSKLVHLDIQEILSVSANHMDSWNYLDRSSRELLKVKDAMKISLRSISPHISYYIIQSDYEETLSLIRYYQHKMTAKMNLVQRLEILMICKVRILLHLNFECQITKYHVPLRIEIHNFSVICHLYREYLLRLLNSCWSIDKSTTFSTEIIRKTFNIFYKTFLNVEEKISEYSSGVNGLWGKFEDIMGDVCEVTGYECDWTMARIDSVTNAKVRPIIAKYVSQLSEKSDEIVRDFHGSVQGILANGGSQRNGDVASLLKLAGLKVSESFSKILFQLNTKLFFVPLNIEKYKLKTKIHDYTVLRLNLASVPFLIQLSRRSTQHSSKMDLLIESRNDQYSFLANLIKLTERSRNILFDYFDEIMDKVEKRVKHHYSKVARFKDYVHNLSKCIYDQYFSFIFDTFIYLERDKIKEGSNEDLKVEDVDLWPSTLLDFMGNSFSISSSNFTRLNLPNLSIDTLNQLPRLTFDHWSEAVQDAWHQFQTILPKHDKLLSSQEFINFIHSMIKYFVISGKLLSIWAKIPGDIDICMINPDLMADLFDRTMDDLWIVSKELVEQSSNTFGELYMRYK